MSRRFYHVRVSVLSLVLVGVLAYAALDRARRSARRDWQRPLSVALILLQEGPLEPAALDRLQRRVTALEAVLEAEFARYGGDFRPISFQQFGPVPELSQVPIPAAQSSLWHSLWLSLELGSYARKNDRAAGLGRATANARGHRAGSVGRGSARAHAPTSRSPERPGARRVARRRTRSGAA